MEPSVRLNNAGVDLLEAGNKRVAWDLFKGALEVKLAMERTGFQYQPPAPRPQQGSTGIAMMDVDDNENHGTSPSSRSSSASSPSLDAFLKEAAASNAYIKRAEDHYARLRDHLERRAAGVVSPSGTALAPAPPPPPSFICPTVTDSSMGNSSSRSTTRIAGVGIGQSSEPYYDQVAPTTGRRHPLFRSSGSGGVFHFGSHAPRTLDCDDNEPFTLYTPFIYAKSIKLPEDRNATSIETTSSTTTTSRRDSAAIIFNLALVDHMQHRKSKQAVALYELAMTLLTGDAVDILGIALVNNIGVWCYENEDEDGALRCMGHLATFVRSNGVNIEQEMIREGLHSNILFLLNPPFAASPAA